MKKLFLIPIIILFISCSKEVKYPVYSLETIEYIPDTLQEEHRVFITETVRAASQHMTAGDYEDIDETIIQAERTANNIFSSKILGLRKEIDESYYNDILLKPCEMNKREIFILDSLKNK